MNWCCNRGNRGFDRSGCGCRLSQVSRVRRRCSLRRGRVRVVDRSHFCRTHLFRSRCRRCKRHRGICLSRGCSFRFGSCSQRGSIRLRCRVGRSDCPQGAGRMWLHFRRSLRWFCKLCTAWGGREHCVRHTFQCQCRTFGTGCSQSHFCRCLRIVAKTFEDKIGSRRQFGSRSCHRCTSGWEHTS